MKNLMRKSRGFTLVELLIVMIIIGILAGGMMMVMGSSTDKADATKALSDLRTMASATLQYYADKGATAVAPGLGDLSALMNKTLDAASYGVQASGDQTWVTVFLPTEGSRAKLVDTMNQEKLNLLGDVAASSDLSTADAFTATDTWAYMRAK